MSTAAETVTKPAAETATKPAAEPVTKPVEASTPETTKAPITQDRIYIGNLPAKVKYDEIREFLDGLTVYVSLLLFYIIKFGIIRISLFFSCLR